MKFTELTRRVLAKRRQSRNLIAAGYIEREVMWELDRGGMSRTHHIADVVVSLSPGKVFIRVDPNK